MFVCEVLNDVALNVLILIPDPTLPLIQKALSRTNQSVEVGVGRSLDVEVLPADIVDSLVVDHEGTVDVLERSVRGQDGVVGFHHRRADLRER